MFKNTKKQGDWGLGLAIAYFTSKGITISIPLTDSQDYDLVIDLENQLKRVQVKSTFHKVKSGNYTVSLTTKGGNKSSSKIKKLDKNSVDFIFIATGNSDLYLIPCESVNSSITLSSKYQQYKLDINF